jgi:hypothetical protein
MRSSKTTVRNPIGRIGVVLAVTAAGLVGTATPSFALAVPLTLSQNQGPSVGGNTVSVTSGATSTSDGKFPAGTVIEFQAALATATATSCSAAYIAPGTLNAPPSVASSVKVYTPNRLTFTVPTTLNATAAVTRFSVCAYPGTVVAVPGTGAGSTPGSLLIGSALYSVSQKPAISALVPPVPSTGPAMGGTMITVTGTGFPTAVAVPPAAPTITATLGGLPLTGIVVAAGGTSFTALTAAHAAGPPVDLIVTTGGGPTTMLDAFTYSNGITVAPGTGPNTKLAGTDIFVQGVGFASTDFSTTTGSAPDDANGHVYLVHGTYDPAGANLKAVPETSECNGVIAFDDSDLICTLNLAGQQLPGRTFTDGVVTGTTTLTSTAAAFTAADVGRPIMGTGFAANTWITAVTATTATLSVAAGNGAITTASISGARTVVGTTVVGLGLTLTVGTLSSLDVGLSVVGPGVALGATIVSITSPTVATLSAAGTAVTGTSAAPITIARPRTITDGVFSATPGLTILTSATAIFTDGDITRLVTGTGIPAYTTITAVGVDGKTATISAAATAGTGVTVAITSGRKLADGISVTGTALSGGLPMDTVTSTLAKFSADDIGRTISGSGIPTGTTIKAVSGAGPYVATLSKATTAAVTSALTFTVSDLPPVVPIGTYSLTIVNDGTLGTKAASTTYSQSIITSGSTFTVADY